MYGVSLKSLLLLILLVLYSQGKAQLFNGDNYVVIQGNEGEADRIRKAVHVVPSLRQLQWQELELTGFLHFGINTFTNREWGDGTEDPKLFNPSQLDARQWVRACKLAGIRSVILTAKHHDGFCLWPSRYTEHSVKNSPWKGGNGDVVQEVAAACKEYDVGFGIYLSPWDRHEASFGDSATYNDYFVNQLTELLTQYGKIAEVWFDGANGEGPHGKKQVYDFNRWYALIRKLQPQAVIAVMGPDVRWVGTETGRGRETEWSVVPADAQLQETIAAHSQQQLAFVPANRMEEDLGSREQLRKAKSLVWYPAETDVSIRPGWFYHASEDSLVKTASELMDIYYESVGRNGVLLLNIPPDRRGLLCDADLKQLAEWTRLRQQTFKNNLLRKASLRTSGRNARALVDHQSSTWWTTQKNDTIGVIEFQLKQEQECDLLLLQEAIQNGQRIERFVVEYREGAEWKWLTEGTTVGYKRILRFPLKRVQFLRIRILSSRLNPMLAEAGLYRQAR
ncbi:MAG TPA: alpha-L-fucosidase [Flavisolibacter sp.]|jgi:alpha-L-fucosidase|nr:alpha-L-fucosidase [Flavisolibacter sp.]